MSKELLITFSYRGQQSTTFPKWIGLTGAIRLIDDINTQIDTLNTKATQSFAKLNQPWSTNDPINLKATLQGFYNKYKSR